MVQKKSGATILKKEESTSKNESAKTVQMASPEQRVKTISEQIEYFNRKHEILKKRRRFESTKENLSESYNQLPTDDDPDFERNPTLKMTFTKDYSTTVCTISNPVVLREIIEVVMKKIEDRIFSLDEELIN